MWVGLRGAVIDVSSVGRSFGRPRPGVCERAPHEPDAPPGRQVDDRCTRPGVLVSPESARSIRRTPRTIGPRRSRNVTAIIALSK